MLQAFSSLKRWCFKFKWTASVVLLLAVAALWHGWPPSDAEVDQAFDRQLPVIRTLYLVDDRFLELDRATLNEALQVAQETLRERLALADPTFIPLEIRPISPWFDNVLRRQHDALATYPLTAPPPQSLNPRQRDFYAQYSLDELRHFLPSGAPANVSLEEFHRLSMNAWAERLQHLMTLNDRGKELFTPEQSPWQLASNWRLVLMQQGQYDLILTNTAIFYDLLDEPFPHVVWKKGKIGGMGIYHEGAMVSTVGLTDLPYVGEQPAVPAQEKGAILGAVLIAHELGHSLLGLLDIYDHPLDCLMNSATETSVYHDAWVALNSTHRVCPQCRELITQRKALGLDLMFAVRSSL